MSDPALAVRCGVCGAHEAEPCRTRANVLTDKPHAVRRAAAKRKKAGAGPPHSV